ncbi:protein CHLORORESPIRATORY REDUCTION 42, chloroplastic [Arachis duranensis]|uniref:Protein CHLORORESPIRATORY REDUCTION 42, chloroplastic n=1 Tax=Arachis duranensis TaxID=130453 RepID=A0A6P4DX16_ARADU|nr:protein CHLORORESPIRATORY REDUCTION 42, chloroplastic [Arachis duranensis]
MALPYSFATTTKSSVFSKLQKTCFFQHNQLQRANAVTVVKCESKDSSEDNIELQAKGPKLQIGSPIIFTEAPKMIKTAASVPCLRVNSGLVKPGDVGRIVSRKPKDVWAVRLSIGTFLIDGKYFKPLDLAEYS